LNIWVCDSLEECGLVEAEAVQTLKSFFAAVLPRPFVHLHKSKLVGTAKKHCPLPDLKYLSFSTKFSSSRPVTTFCQLSSFSWTLCRSVILCSTAAFAALRPNMIVVLAWISFSWASGLSGQYDSISDPCCAGADVQSILWCLIGDLSSTRLSTVACPSFSLLLRLSRVIVLAVMTDEDHAHVDGITSTFAAACRTFSNHALFNGLGYAACWDFSVK
jgi:hypothetical protein